VSSLPFQHPRADCSLCPRALSEAPTSSLAWSPLGRLASRRAMRRTRFSSCATAGLNPDSRQSAPWLVVRKAPVVSLASWLASFWTSFCRPTMPWAWSPFHHSSEPKRAAARTHADWTRRQFSGDRPTCPASLRSRFWAFLAFFNRTSWCSFKVSWESSQTPSHRVACALKWTVCPATWMPRGGAAGVLRFLRLLKRIASDFSVSKATAFTLALEPLPLLALGSG